MKIANWDSGLFFDDPNLIWGDPAYLREPGDPGYVAPFPTRSKPTTKNKRMKHNAYYPVRIADQIVWLTNFKNKIGGYVATLGLTAGQSTAIIADCNWLIYVLQNWLASTRTFALACTQAASDAQTGNGATLSVLTTFTPPVLPVGTAAVNNGALLRIFALAQQIKDGGKSSDAINTDLGIVGSTQTAPDLSTRQPLIAVAINGSQVDIKWGWGGNRAYLDSIELQVDRGDGHGFVLLTIDTTPNYTDTQPFPTAQTRWSYRGIYRVNDHQIGLWSATVSVIVPG
jgi:hypothetical protein